MAPASPAWHVRVPASTSNLGPGFDLLGLALDLPLEVDLRECRAGAHALERLGPERAHLPPIEQDLLLRAFEAVRAATGFPGHFRFEVRSAIPVGRGLGSSGAAVVAGALLARALAREAGGELDDERLLALCVEQEGHPDNVAAALFGGLTLCVQHGPGRWRRVHPPLSPRIGIAVAWPAEPLPTARARSVLPAQVPFPSAVENPRRLALLLEGLRSGDPGWIEFGAEDRLHVPYRLPLLPGTPEAFRAARAAGAWMATLSGAGSGLVALGERGRMQPVAEAMAEVLRRHTGAGQGRVLEPCLGSPEVARGRGGGRAPDQGLA